MTLIALVSNGTFGFILGVGWESVLLKDSETTSDAIETYGADMTIKVRILSCLILTAHH